MTDTDVQIATIQKNARETIRVALRTFKGHRSIDVRLFAAGRDGEDIATAKGLSIRPDLLDDVLGALKAARDKAVAEGLIAA